ncbi:MAG TPA: Rid family hydrolase [Candidatus Acidoferrales bacterium]|nr:Rid family hydrolase [Candidatus Acidoferrales bacterium]
MHIPPPAGFGPLPFSSGVLVGETFYVSGHIGIDPATKRVPPEADQEARLMLDGFRETLARGGCSMGDLVYVQIFCSDVSLFEKFNAIYRTYFETDLPSRAFIGSGPLLFGARFEMQGIAVKRDGGRMGTPRKKNRSTKNKRTN